MSRKIDLVVNTIRCITNQSDTGIDLKNNIQMMLDSGYAEEPDIITDEELAEDSRTADLTFAKFSKVKTFSDAYQTFLAADGRAMEKILNELRTVVA